MADSEHIARLQSEHLARLKKGVSAWNRWKKRVPKESLDPLGRLSLRDANLEGVELAGADLNNVDLGGASLSHAKLSHAELKKANLAYADLQWSDLSSADLSGAWLYGANLNSADMTSANLSRTRLSRATLLDSKAPHADFTNAELDNADLTRANLHAARLVKAVFSWAKLSHANLSKANLARAHMLAADLSSANGERANLRHAMLADSKCVGTQFSRADMRDTTLWGAILKGADMTGTKLQGASVFSTVFAGIDLRAVIGLAEVQHLGPSSIGIDTLRLSAKKCPEAFWRGAGLPDKFVDDVPSIGTSIPFYSCFISYSTKDRQFANRLHAHLQAKGIQCWFAPHDIRGGEKLHEQIDAAIRRYDKLLLILSPASMASEWVKTEILKAGTREANEQRRMLFPVRLVDFDALRAWHCFDADTGRDLAREVREYYIPDFSAWKTNPDSYKQALDRLVNDLRAQSEAHPSQ